MRKQQEREQRRHYEEQMRREEERRRAEHEQVQLQPGSPTDGPRVSPVPAVPGVWVTFS